MVIDAEVHFWKYGKATAAPLIRENKVLQEDYLPSDIALNLRRNEVAACVAVSAEATEVETRFLAELALTHPVISGVVGWTDLNEAMAPEKIQELSAYTAIRGFKLSGDADFAKLHAVTEALLPFGYSLDVELLPATNISGLNSLIRHFPDQAFVLQNCGSPDAKGKPANSWQEQIHLLAKNKNLYCKVSGLFTAANWKSWKPGDFYPFLDLLFKSFGPDRLLYASDWPFLLLSGAYVQWKSLLEKYTEHLSEEQHENFFGENARRVYRL
ncbi:MAG TPA: amidohydrolase family protein [Puia sp.]|nr:amidohydrolase family protein [Puia sp.]